MKDLFTLSGAETLLKFGALILLKERPAPQFLLADHPPLAEGPYYRFETHSGSHHFSFSKSEKFGFTGDMFLAQYGSQFIHPPKGHKVVRFNPKTKEVSNFYVNKVPGAKGVAPERPTAAHFSHHDGSLYIVDFGELATNGKVFFPSAETGALWKITKVESFMDGVGKWIPDLKIDAKSSYTILGIVGIILIGYLYMRKK
jgi:hypothetical protein